MRKAGSDGWETLFCQVHGFYPKEIDVTWMKGREVWHQDVYTGGVVPNSDGTYHTWLSIEVDPKERDLYRCHVEHDGLLEPLDLAWEEPADCSVLDPVLNAGAPTGRDFMGVILAGILLGGGAIF